MTHDLDTEERYRPCPGDPRDEYHFIRCRECWARFTNVALFPFGVRPDG